MNLIKTSFLTAISTFTAIICHFIINKIVAVYIGPGGVAFLGQLFNFTSASKALSTGGTSVGVTKYIAEYSDIEEKRSQIISTSLIVSLACSLLLSVPIIVFRNALSSYLFKTDSYASIFVIFGVLLVFLSLNTLLLSILNGYKEIKKYVAANIGSSILSLLLTLLLALMFGLYGALLAFAIAQSAIVFFTFSLFRKSTWFSPQMFYQGIDKESLYKLLKFSAMIFVSMFTYPIALILVRNYITDSISLDAAGYWEGVWRISEGYLLLITTSLTIYYLPTLSEIKEPAKLQKEIINGYKFLLPIVVVSALTIYMLREYIIIILYTDAFLPMRDLFLFQLIGDVVKISSWILAHLMLAKAMTRAFIITELIFISSFVILSISFISIFGLVGVTYAFALNYTLYLITMIWLFKDVLLLRQKRHNHE